MLTLQIQDGTLENQLTELLRQKFGGDPEKMLHEFVRTYMVRLNRLKYCGILKWDQEGVDYQKELRGEW